MAPTALIQKPLALSWPTGFQYDLVSAVLPNAPCHAFYMQGISRCLRFPAYAMLFPIHVTLCMASLSSGMSSSSSPTEPLANSHSSIKIMPWYNFLKKAFHAYHQPSPQAGLCAQTFSLNNNSWRWTLLLGPFVDGKTCTVRQRHLP